MGTAGPPYPQPPPGARPSTPPLPLPDTSQQITIKRQSFSSNKCGIVYNESAGRAHGGRSELAALNGAGSRIRLNIFKANWDYVVILFKSITNGEIGAILKKATKVIYQEQMSVFKALRVV